MKNPAMQPLTGEKNKELVITRIIFFQKQKTSKQCLYAYGSSYFSVYTQSQLNHVKLMARSSREDT